MRVPRASGNLANRAAPPSVPKVLRAHPRNRRDRPRAQRRTARTRAAALPGCRGAPRPAELLTMTAVLRRATRRSQSFPSQRRGDDDSPRCGRASKRSPQPMNPKSTSVPSACARVHASVHACCAARVPAGSMRRRTRAPVARSSAEPAARTTNRSAIRVVVIRACTIAIGSPAKMGEIAPVRGGRAQKLRIE